MKTDIELISIGSELLSGRTLNTHAQTLGAALTKIGLSLSRDTTIPDDIELIRSAVRDAFDRTDIVVVSGGLGPTSDDITRDALAGLFGCKIVVSPEGLAAMKKDFAARGRIMSPVSERMAQILDGARTLVNSVGAAAGQLFCPVSGLSAAALAHGHKILFVLPGPPNEFAAMLADHLVPWMRKNFPDAIPCELRVLTTQGIGESDIVTRLESVNFQFPDTSIGYYPGGGKVEIRLTAAKEYSASLDAAANGLRVLLEDFLID